MDWNLVAGVTGAAAGIGSFAFEAWDRMREPAATEDDVADELRGGPAISNWAFAGAITLLMYSVLFLVGQQLEKDGEDQAYKFIYWGSVLLAIDDGGGCDDLV